MKVLFLAFLALAVGANAYPQQYGLETSEPRLITNQIRDVIEGISRWLIVNGWDPLRIQRLVIQNSPQPGIEIGLTIEDLELVGLADIRINRLDYNVVSNRMRMDLEWPRVSFRTRKAAVETTFHGVTYKGELGGTFLLTGLRLNHDLRFQIRVIGGITVRSSDCQLRIQGLASNLNLVINEQDLSGRVNEVINVTIPNWLRVNQARVDQLYSDVIKEVITQVLG